MSELEKVGIDNGTIDALNLILKTVLSSGDFVGALKNGVSKKGVKEQAFEGTVLSTWDDILYSDRPETQKPKRKKGATSSKNSLVELVFMILSDIESSTDLQFRVLDRSKGVGAIKDEGMFYEIKFTSHKKQVAPSEAKNLRKSIAKLAETLKENNNVIAIKNNQVTVESPDGSQTSVKIVKKKEALF